MISVDINHLTTAGLQMFGGLMEIANVLTTRLREYRPIERSVPRRLTFVQFGDYAEAFWRFAKGGPETYYAQKYAVEFVASLADRQDVECVTSVSFSSNLPTTVLPNGVRTVGVELYPKGQRPRHHQLVEAVRQTNPTHLIVRIPSIPLIRWGIRAMIPVLPMFADSFRARGVKASLQYRLLAFLLNSSSIELVSNRNLSASLDLQRIGVEATKIVLYDWPPIISPRDYESEGRPCQQCAFSVNLCGKRHRN
jgi:hypothetical protein